MFSLCCPVACAGRTVSPDSPAGSVPWRRPPACPGGEGAGQSAVGLTHYRNEHATARLTFPGPGSSCPSDEDTLVSGQVRGRKDDRLWRLAMRISARAAVFPHTPPRRSADGRSTVAMRWLAARGTCPASATLSGVCADSAHRAPPASARGSLASP